MSGTLADEVDAITAEALARRVRTAEALTVLDVRDRDEFERWHVDGPAVEAVQIPHQKFLAARVNGTTEDLVGDRIEPVVVVCGRGKASDDVAAQLRDAGYDAVNLAGGMESWAEVYLAEAVPWSGGTLLQYQRPSSGCLAYLVVAGDEAVVVDPLRAFADRYADDAAEYGADLVAAVDTHVHADHVSGVRAIADRTGAESVLPEGATDRGLAFEPDRLVADGDEVAVGDARLRAHHFPGHTTEMTALVLGDGERVDLLLGGDLLFPNSVARPDLEPSAEGVTAMARTLHETLHDRVRSLPDEIRLLPGHHSARARTDDGVYLARLGDLYDRLDLLGLDEETFVEEVTESVPPRPANDERIVGVNLGQESVTDETAFELELGPNNCAAE